MGNNFITPLGVAVDASGNIFVADSGNSEVKEIVAQGGFATINVLGSGFGDPSAVAVDGAGNVFVADTGNNSVKEILAASGYTTVNTLASVLKAAARAALQWMERKRLCCGHGQQRSEGDSGRQRVLDG